jgi:hypothetical protein
VQKSAKKILKKNILLKNGIWNGRTFAMGGFTGFLDMKYFKNLLISNNKSGPKDC